MVVRIILFVLGIVFYLHSCTHNLWVMVFFCVVIIIGLFYCQKQYAVFFLGGLLWVMSWGLWSNAHQLPTYLEGRDIKVVGVVSGLPIKDQYRTKFDLKVTHSENGPIPEKIRLNWYSPPRDIRAGQKWLFTVRLKKPHGYANPGGFDYEKWLFTQGIGANGYVRAHPVGVLMESSVDDFSSANWRQYFHMLLTKQMSHSPYYGVSEALVIGYKANISQEQWQLFKNTGTIHLVVISGMHIGLIAAIAYFITLKGLTRFKGFLISPPQLAAGITIVVSSFYAALSGFTIPTQRALTMLVVIMLSIMWQRHSRPINVLLLALLVVVLLNPYAILSAGMWLSFSAVGLIQYVLTARLRSPGYGLSTIKVHIILIVGLMPLLIASFQQFSVLSPLANAFAVPLVTFWIVPLLMLSVMASFFSDILGGLIFKIVELGFDILLGGLSVLARQDFAIVNVANSNPFSWVLAFLGAMILMMPRGLPGRWLGLVFLGPILMVIPESVERGEYKLTLLDVGQGLSAVVQTANHTLVYDTGARFPTGDLGERVVIPFLRFNNLNTIDVLMVSHSDNDHIGGVQSILKVMDVKEVITSEPQAFSTLKPSVCNQGQQWQWDGVTFSILSPGNKRFKTRNNNSCVLKVSSFSGSVLLPGDIELPREVFLTNQLKAELKADVLIAPHHGSNTSSSEVFLSAVSPRWVLIPAGYRNRFKFPSSEVLERYKRKSIEAFNVSDTGAFAVNFKQNTIDLSAYKENKNRCY